MPIKGRSTVLLLLCALAALLLAAAPASAGIVAKDGKIHACYKAKGKGKGKLRVVRSAKVKCPKKWKKTAWYAVAVPGPQGEAGAPGGTGASGAAGEPGPQGLPGRNENVVVNELEDKVAELLAKLQGLESVVGTLCAQTKKLNEQTTALGSGFSTLNTTLSAILGMVFAPPSVPAALPAFSCPS